MKGFVDDIEELTEENADFHTPNGSRDLPVLR